MLNYLSSPHSNILPSSKTVEKSLLLYKSVMFSIMNPIIQRNILNWLLFNISRNALLTQREILFLLIKFLYLPLVIFIMLGLEIWSQVIWIFRPLVAVEKLASVIRLVLKQGYDGINIGPRRDLKLLMSGLNDRLCPFSRENALLGFPNMRHFMDFLKL